jgi:hypothetical protein
MPEGAPYVKDSTLESSLLYRVLSLLALVVANRVSRVARRKRRTSNAAPLSTMLVRGNMSRAHSIAAINRRNWQRSCSCYV